MERIFHLAEPALWERARAKGWYAESTRGLTLAEVGFIHCSFERQVETVANRVYADWQGDLLLLEVEPGEVPAEVRVECPDGGSDGFPHVYGPLPTASVKAVHRLSRQPGGWVLPGGL